MRKPYLLLIFSLFISAHSSPSHSVSMTHCSELDNRAWHNCYGRIKLPSGDEYIGGFLNGKFFGYGSYENARGGAYVGEWRDGVPHGEGKATFSDGRTPAEGTWESGKLITPRPSVDLTSAFAAIQFAQKYSSHSSAPPATNGTPENQDVLRESNRFVDAKPQDKQQSLSGKPRLALLIGNSDYPNSPLANPLNDVRGMAQALRKAGFTVIKHENLNFRQMRSAVRDFGENLTKDHVGLFYYSGHGVQVDGKNYLIPVGSDIKYEDEVATSALDADLVLAKLESARNNLNIVVLDACRDSPLGRRARNATRGLSNMNAARGTMIAFSTSPGQVALDGSGSNSPYTKHLIRAIQKEGMLLELVFKDVRASVVRETNGKQVPWENSSVLGDFYFIPKK